MTDRSVPQVPVDDATVPGVVADYLEALYPASRIAAFHENMVIRDLSYELW